ncbi:protease family c26 gamma-glutamyl hydrolase [Anaeramoeba flamelloides]|uniref:folate gamma-glutamyl hydrolase n=1 Tax=Anaeramoeba flamelloides TaxID=1746091 RepID=A0ABQ8XAQ1_9EUKA|nr:protease family c26 gamma-glutamyl hydrolase [Anaeramoeba flamelloides]
MNFPFFRLLFLFIIFSIFSTCNTSPSHPIIGILTQPTTNYPDFGKVYVPSSYVKWIEASGGKAVYIDYQLSHSELEQLFNKVNGLVFIGGGLDIDPHIKYIDSAWYLFNLTKQAYDKHNEWVPIWGTCLGFQMLSVFSTGDLDFLDRFDSWDMALPLNFTTQLKESRIFKGIPSSYLNYFQKYNVTINWHTYGVTSGYQTKHKESFQKYSSFFRIVSNNSGRKGKNFVSTIESYRYPIYGSQWVNFFVLFFFFIEKCIFFLYELRSRQICGELKMVFKLAFKFMVHKECQAKRNF